ncbi:pyridoxal phosphate-dependent aminotransferase [Variovorax sp. KK3]
MNARASEMARGGRDVIPLSLGEPDFHTPDNVKEAGIAAIRRDFTKYTPTDGYAQVKKSIAAKLARENGMTCTPDQIVVGGGAKVIILAAVLSIVNPGDEVVIPAPYWVTYPDQVELAGGKPVFVEGKEATGFKVTPEDLAAALTPRTRAIIFNSPSNPSGAVYTAEEIKALAAVLAPYPEVWIVTDELYEHLTFDGKRAVSFGEAAPELLDRVITINGFSKGYVMTGWRLAFAAGPRAIIKSMSDLLSQLTGSPNSIAQAAAVEALDGDQGFIAANRATFQARRDLVVDAINRIPGLSCLRPAGTFYVYINCGGWLDKTTQAGRRLGSDIDVAEALLDEAELATVPGTVFGLSPFFRISIALEQPLLLKAMERLSAFAAAFR